MFPFNFHFLGLMLLLSLSRLCCVVDGEVVCLEARMFTPSLCADNPDFVDWDGYECVDNDSIDC